MKTTDDQEPPTVPGDEELLGVSLRRYACVYAGLSEGFELEAVLENEGISAPRWPAVDRAWTTRIADDHEAEAILPHPFDVLLAEGQGEYARRVPPLDEDVRAFFDFMRLWPEDPEPLALLERLGLGPNDVIRLQRGWAVKMASDEALRRQVEEILMEDAGPMPAVMPAPATLPPRQRPQREAVVPAVAALETVSADAPPPVPGLAVPLPRAGEEADRPSPLPVAPAFAPPPVMAPTVAAMPLPPPKPPPRPATPPPVAAAPSVASRSPWVESPALEHTMTAVVSPFAAKLPFEAPPRPDVGPPPRSDPGPRPRADLGHTTTGVVSPFATEALPFAPAAPKPLEGRPTAPEDARFAAWSLDQYAALCAELAMFSTDTEATFKKYGLHAAADRTALDGLFRRRLAEDPATYAEWQALYWRYRNHWSANPRR